MNCLWRDVPDTADHRGWRRVECRRCGIKTGRTPHPHAKIHSRCKSRLPLWHEFGQWASLLLFVLTGINRRRWSWVKARLGLKPCKCGERAAAMDSWGQRLARLLGR